MSTQDAVRFLQIVRDDDVMQAAICSGRCSLDASGLADLAAGAGLRFDAADLAVAFRHDWALRNLLARRATQS